MKKNIFALITLFVITLASCDKNEINENVKTNEIETLKLKSVEFSNKHDSLVKEMLNLEQSMIKQKSKSKGVSSVAAVKLDNAEIIEVIEKITGIRPSILSTDASNSKQSKIKALPALEIDLDVEEINLSDYATTDVLRDYLTIIDVINQDATMSLSDKTGLFSSIQNEVINDPYSTMQDCELFLNSTEVLNGSLQLWSNKLAYDIPLCEAGMYRVAPNKWKWWKKIAFIAAADALGAIAGSLTGMIVTVGGAPIYIPPGAAVVSAAALSFIAYHIVYP